MSIVPLREIRRRFFTARTNLFGLGQEKLGGTSQESLRLQGDHFSTSAIEVTSFASIVNSHHSLKTGTEGDYKKGMKELIPTTKSKYSGSRFKQERLLAFVIRIQLRSLAWYFIPMGFVLILTGFLLLITTPVAPIVLDYTDCKDARGKPCARVLKINGPMDGCQCDMTLAIPRDLPGKVYLNYELTNMFHTPRYYIRSKDDDQLSGSIFGKNCTARKPDKFCEDARQDKKIGKKGKPTYPCGRIANAMFSDTIVIKTSEDKPIRWKRVPAFDKTEIKQKKYVNITKTLLSKKSKCKLKDLKRVYEKPPNWSKQFWEMFLESGGPRNEEFIKWARPSAFQTFTVPLQYFDGRLPNCKSRGICKGKYKVHITYRYNTKPYGGRKMIVLTQDDLITSSPNGRNFLIITSLTIGSIALAIGLVALILAIVKRIRMNLKKPSKSKTFNASDRGPQEAEANNGVKGEQSIPAIVRTTPTPPGSPNKPGSPPQSANNESNSNLDKQGSTTINPNPNPTTGR